VPTRHPQIAQREQRPDLHGVLIQPSVALFRDPELHLEDAERVLNLRSATSCGSMKA